jgi:hypothetical protein
MKESHVSMSYADALNGGDPTDDSSVITSKLFGRFSTHINVF